MIKTVAALMALVVGGFAGAALTADTDAQRIEVEDEKNVILERQGEKRSNSPRPAFQRGSGQMQNGQREQWQIREVNDWIMLFNPSSGETFYLEDDDEDVYWKPIERRGGPGRRAREERDDDRREGRDDDRSSQREKLERYLDELEERVGKLKEKLEDADGRQRKKIERTLEQQAEEIKKVLRKLANPK